MFETLKNKFWPQAPEDVQRELINSRNSYELIHFLEESEKNGISNVVAESVWDNLKHEAVAGFNPKLEDNLNQVFGLVDEELDDLAEKIFIECKCAYPNPEKSKNEKPVETVLDLARFAERHRKQL